MNNEKLKEQIRENEKKFISKLMDCLVTDPNVTESDKSYAIKHLRSYLRELTDKEDSLLYGLIVALETYLEK